MSAPDGAVKLLSGWGRTSPTRAEVARVTDAQDVLECLEASSGRGVVARGLGRSYGDAAQNAGGQVIDTTALAWIRDFDRERGEIIVGAGASFGELLRVVVPTGWFLPVLPGTRHVTVGGAIACDVHGKNHHRDGSFSRHVDWLTLATPDGRVRRVGPRDDPEAFRATTGGMGLTGVILEARIRLLPMATSAIRVTTERAANLDGVMDRMKESDADYKYSVAWIDCLTPGRDLGRGVLTRGNHAQVDELPRSWRRRPLALPPSPSATAPLLPRGLLSGPAVRAFNEVWFRKAPKHAVKTELLGRFFYPLDGLRNWNRLYGPSGLLQYQAVVPMDRDDCVRVLLERLQAVRAPAFLAVLKRLGPGSGLLSFPAAGWTLAVDMPADHPALPGLLDEFDELVATSGGRLYLAKDSRLRPEVLDQMYPELDEWRRIRRRLDPGGVLVSDLGRRLRLSER
jgi:decaprenylphospho-beta-D-ribofuranose 2-oxidase